MLLGQENIQKTFSRLVKENKLSHGYIFFGEPQVGKYSFALSLASFLENGEFEEILLENGFPKHILKETLIIRPIEGTIGIDAVRDIKHFLSEKPVYGGFRTVVIDEAENLTPQAENAILKIAEEPPVQSILILITPNVDSFIPTLKSRFQKIHFPRVKNEEIKKLLEKNYAIESKRAEEIAKLSHGRPGRAISLIGDEKAKERFKLAASVLAGKTSRHQAMESFIENQTEIYLFLTEIIAKLANNPIKNYDTLRSITRRITGMSRFQLNKRLQTESAIWNI